MATSNRNNGLVEEAFHLLVRTITRTDPSRLEEWVGLGLTMTQIRLLFVLRLQEGANARLLADLLNVAPPTFTRIVDRLVRNDLVRREVDPRDRRHVLHFLTENGRETVAEMERVGRARIERVLSHLSEEQLERLVLALNDLFTATEAVEVEERPAGVRV
ncbi:MAG: MarR family transcriptional regulator [Chloroflexi bacterium]|nr:MarR family transcriptional regulator [Chloroflexota bacterium]